MLEINRKLYLVITIDQGGRTLYAHSTAIDTPTFDTNFMMISKAFSTIYQEGLGLLAGPRVASRLLRQTAANMDTPEAASALIGEIHRLTNIFAPDGNQWKLFPFEDAVRAKIIDDEDANDVENAAVFFTLMSHMHRKSERALILAESTKLWGGRVEYLNCTDFHASLPTSTATVSSIVRAG